MNRLLISSSLFATTSLILAIAVPFFARKKVHILWSVFNLFVSLWGFSLVLICLSKTPEQARFWWIIANLAGVMIAPVFCHFVVEFVDRPKKSFLAYAYAQAIIINGALLLGGIHFRLEPIYHSVYYLRATDWTYFTLKICWVSCVLYGHFVLIKALLTASSDKKVQIRYLMLATFIGFFFGGGAHFLHVFGFPVDPAWNALVTVYTLLASYSIFRHRLMGIDFAVRKSLFYTLLISMTTIFYFASLVLLERLFQKTIGYHSLIATIATLAMIIIISEPLRIKTQALIDRLFFKGSIAHVAEEREMLHKEVQKQDQLKSVATLAAGMAHEIKNPLTSIKTFAEYLPEKYGDPVFREKFQRIVVDEVDRVNNIVQQLLDFSKPKELRLEPAGITSILDETLELLNSNLLKHKISVIRNYNNSPSISVDKNQLKQAFLNIFLNSIQAMPDGGALTINVIARSAATEPSKLRSHFDERSEEKSQSVIVTISDTGCGIPEDHLPHVFDPFHTTKEDGTGLGLSIVHGIIQGHGGKIEVKSETGKGTTIRIVLKTRA